MTRMFVLLYLYDYCCIVITSILLADCLILFRHLLHILGTLQGMEQGSIIHGVIQSVCAEKDAVKCLKFHGLDIRHIVLWMMGEECPVDIGRADGAGLDVVNGSILDIAFDVNDIASAVTCMAMVALALKTSL